ncbi:PsbQ-like protein [Gracilaria domingensis]|nr:PsbQ-like protein [Gracilaria domingensis]
MQQTLRLRPHPTRRRSEASTITEAMLELKAVEGALPKLESVADAADYDSLRLLLRTAPLNRIRAACSTLYRSLPDEARRKQAEGAYKKLIRSVEETDVKALRVSRGEIQEDLSPLVHQVHQLFDEFSVLVAE